MKRRFSATVQQHPGNASLFVEVPFDPGEVFGKVRAPVRVTVHGVTISSRIAKMGGVALIGFNKASREATGVKAGETVKFVVELDEGERTVTPPDDLMSAMRRRKGALAAWKKLSYTHQKEHVQAIVGAKKAETRARRIAKCLEMLVG